MNKSVDEIFELFHKKLSTEHVYDTNKYESEILSYYNQILDILSSNYVTYRKYISRFLSTLENYNTKSVTYSICIFFQLLKKVLALKDTTELDISVLDEIITDQTYEKFLKSLEESTKDNIHPRISNFELNTNNLSEKEIKEIVSFLINMIQENSKTHNQSAEMEDVIMMILPVLRYLLNTLNNIELFYFSAGIFLDRLNILEYFQLARDFSEEIISSGFKDIIPEFGFFNSFKCYANQRSIHAAIIYANISLHCAIKKGKPIIDKYKQEIISQSLKYFRNIKIFDLAIKIYKRIPDSLKFSEYERRSIDYTYFTCLLAIMDKRLPKIILDYLNKERKSIFKAGIHESTPWLITLYNIKRLYPEADFSIKGLGFYINIFEEIVPEATVEKYKNMIDGDSTKLKVYLKKSIIKLNETRYKSDIVYDNEAALKIANRIIEDSFVKQDEEAVLLAMMLKSDFSLIFQPKEAKDIIPFKLPNDEIEEFNTIYGDKEKLQKNISTDNTELYIWLAVTEGKVFQLSLFNNNFGFNNLTNWEWTIYDKLSKSDYFSSMSFDDTIKDKCGVREVLTEEHIEQATEISKTIDFCKLVIDQKASNIFLVKDMELARFPHNLFLDEQGSFIHLVKPIANILSTEWYLSCKNDSSIENEFSKSIWIPTEEGDFTLNQLYGSLEDILKELQFSVYQDTKIESPISSEINIVCSHGTKDIASKQIIYPGDTPLVNLNHIIGSGKILIFFVCHSGSYKNEFFRNNITSIVKTYIAAGYKAVIAPFWALHVNIPKIWLPVFINSLNKGETIDHALFNANKAVYSKYPTPSAWASMHLYGNPHLAIN